MAMISQYMKWERGTVYPSNYDLPLHSTLSDATLRITYLAKLQPLSILST